MDMSNSLKMVFRAFWESYFDYKVRRTKAKDLIFIVVLEGHMPWQIKLKKSFFLVIIMWIGVLYHIGHKSNLGPKISDIDHVQTFYLPIKTLLVPSRKVLILTRSFIWYKIVWVFLKNSLGADFWSNAPPSFIVYWFYVVD